MTETAVKEEVVIPSFLRGKAAVDKIATPPVKPASKSKLKAVDPKSAEPSKPKILIFGKPGVGKTWGSLDFPAVYYIDTEGGADLPHYTDKLKKSGGVYLGLDQGSLDFETLIDQVKALATEKHPYKTLVIDSISNIFLTQIASTAEALGDKNAYGADKKPAVGYTRRLLSWLQRLDMNVILIAHEKSEWGLNGKGERVEIGSTFDAYDKLEYLLHLCLNIVKAGPDRIAKVKKTRLVQFPEATNFPWSYKEFSTRYGKNVIEGAVKPVVLATKEQIAEFNALLAVVKLPDGQQEKWFKAANVESYEEMDADKIIALIKYVREKLLTPTKE